MGQPLISRRDLDFLLYEWLDVVELAGRERHAEHGRETFDAALDLVEAVAREHFAPHHALSDRREPTFDGTTVHVIPEVKTALEHFADTGLLAAATDAEYGGVQLPRVVHQACFLWFQAANIATAAYPMLTMANANLLLAHATPEQAARSVPSLLDGRWAGTMCLSEPQAGSSLADVATRAVRQDDGSYRLFGNKMWISGGDHELTDNILHLVLARVEGAPAGVRGLSLFATPKWTVDEHGQREERNDVVLAGLNHKMGYRGTVNAVLNFGEGQHLPGGRPGAVGELVGTEGQGLAVMFHMMNEARVGVGAGAVALGYTGYLRALDYARERRQGRPLGHKDPAAAPVPLVEHPDVRRMLVAAKAYAEGGLALVLYAARLLDEQATAPAADRARAGALLDVLTPIVKSWPSQWCLAANDLAIQVHGGYGYTREYSVEQLWRDNRLNPIHEGTHGVQALDLMGRKLVIDGGAGLELLLASIDEAVDRAKATGVAELATYADAVAAWAARLRDAVSAAWASGDAATALLNATSGLEAAGHLVVGWMWLEQLVAVGDRSDDFYRGKRTAGRYFLTHELPRIGPLLDVVASDDRLFGELDPAWL